MKLWTPEDEATAPPPRRTRGGKLPRCRCGCKRAAHWPKEWEPHARLFHTRLCGYKMAVGLILGRRKRV